MSSTPARAHSGHANLGQKSCQVQAERRLLCGQGKEGTSGTGSGFLFRHAQQEVSHGVGCACAMWAVAGAHPLVGTCALGRLCVGCVILLGDTQNRHLQSLPPLINTKFVADQSAWLGKEEDLNETAFCLCRIAHPCPESRPQANTQFTQMSPVIIFPELTVG
jgi:hypothetical protein